GAGPELEVLVETHLLDQDIDLYGRTLEVGFVARLRDERKFGGLDELKFQISADAKEARTLLSSGS
ncbi:MAG: riboflavin kinase, partial [Bdellovibrionales bacterium]|nr:riboflavin kinase [Bdellovibrionales bacterium]